MSSRLVRTLGLVALSTLGCKPKADSTVQNLSNFTRTSTAVTEESCSGNFAVVPDATAPTGSYISLPRTPAASVAALTQSLKTALSSIPTPVQKLYVQLGGKYVLDASATTICSAGLSAADKQFASEQGQQVESCWHMAAVTGTGEPDTTRELDIEILPNSKTIRHATLRSFAFVFSQIMSKLDYDTTQSQPTFNGFDPVFDAQKSTLALALLNDVLANPALSLETYNHLLGNQILTAPASQRAELLAASPGRTQFLHYVFAESFDSYYCSGTTRSQMKTQFPKTYAAFLPLASGLEAIAPANTSGGTGGGLGLADGGGGGLFSGIGRFLFGGDGSGNVFNKVGRFFFGDDREDSDGGDVEDDGDSDDE